MTAQDGSRNTWEPHAQNEALPGQAHPDRSSHTMVGPTDAAKGVRQPYDVQGFVHDACRLWLSSVGWTTFVPCWAGDAAGVVIFWTETVTGQLLGSKM